MVLGLRRTAMPWWRREWIKLLALSTLLVAAGALTERPMSAGARRRSLEKARTSSQGGAVFVVDDAKFDRFITGVPRQYEAFVFFTAAAPSYKCSSCRAHLDEFTALAESYQTAKADTPEVLKAADIFFFVADFTLNQGAFHKLGLQSVPKVMHFPAALTEGEEGRYTASPSQHMQMIGAMKAEDMARFVKERTGASIPIFRSELPMGIILSLLLVAGLLLLNPIVSNIGRILRMVQNKYMWFSISLLVYTFGISGGVYDIIRNPAPFVVKPDGKVVWFHPQSNAQFVAEGFITGFMTLMCGISGILLVQVAPKLGSERARQTAVALFGLSFMFIFVNVMKLYRSKNTWYHPMF